MQSENPYSTSDSFLDAKQAELSFPDSAEPSFQLSRAIDKAKEVYGSQLGPALGIIFSVFVISIGLYGVLMLLFSLFAFSLMPTFGDTAVSMILLAIVVLAALPIMAAGMVLNAGLALSGYYMVHQELSLSKLFVGFRRFWTVLGATLLTFLLTMSVQIAGTGIQFLVAFFVEQLSPSEAELSDPAALILVLLTFPLTFVIWWISLRLFLMPVLIIERGHGVISSLRTSWFRTGPYQWQLLLCFITMGLIMIAGLLACIIGVFFTIPFTMAIYGSAMDQLLGPKESETTSHSSQSGESLS